MSGFFNADTINAKKIADAEQELNTAVEEIRPDEIGANIPPDKDKKAEGFVPAGDANKGHDWQKRYADLQRYIDKKIKPEHKSEIDKLTLKVTELETKLQNALNKGAPENLPQSVAEIETLKRDAPGAYAAIVKLATDLASDIVSKKTADLDSKLADLTKGQELNKAEAAFIELQRRHQDLNLAELSNDEQFNTWLDGQAKIFQDAMRNGFDVDAADGVLSMYKAAYPPTGGKKVTKKKTTQNDDVRVVSAPQLPDGAKGYDFTESQIDYMDRTNPKWFEKNQEAIDKALRENRVLRDVSDPIGTARRVAAEAA